MIWFRKNKKFIFSLFLVAIVSFGFGVYRKHYLPLIKNWALIQITKQSEKYLPVIITAEAIDFELFPLGIGILKVQIQPQDELQKIITPTEIQKISAHLSFWSFITGRLELSEVSFNKFDLKVFLKKTKSTQKTPGFDFAILDQIPVQKVSITNAKLWIQDENSNSSIKAPQINLEVSKRRQALLASLDARSFKVKKTGDQAIFDSDVSFRLRASENEIILNRLRIKKEDSFVLASGTLDWNSQDLSFSRVSGKTRSLIQMQDIEFIAKEFFPYYNIPRMNGRLFLELSTDHRFGKEFKSNVMLRTRSLSVDEFTVGDVKAEGQLDESNTSFSKLEIRHPGGYAELDKLQVQMQSPYVFSTTIKGDKINLQPLLNALKVKDTPLLTDLKPNFECKGQAEKPFRVDCKGDVSSSEFIITNSGTSDASSQIVNFKNISARGNLNLNDKQVTYKAEINMPNTSIQSTGVIDYKGNLNIDASSEKFKLDDVGSVANLKLEGSAKAKGKFLIANKIFSANFDLGTENFKLSGWQLGQVKAQVGYKEGILSFNQAQLISGSSNAKGQLSLNFRKDLISVDTRIDPIDLTDLNAIIPDSLLSLDLNSAGLGTAYFKMFGPISLLKSDWSATLKTQRGLFLGESFDESSFDIESKGGQLTSENCNVKKGTGRINCKLSGNLNSTPIVDVLGTRLSLEQSEIIQANIENLTGFLDFQLNLSQFLKQPQVSSFGTVSGIQLADLPLPAVDFSLANSPQKTQASVKMGTDIVVVDYKSDSSNLDRYELSGKFNNWDFSQLFSAFSDSLRVNTYEANLRGQFSFNGSKSNINDLTGKLEVDSLSLKSSNIKIENTQPMGLTLNNGRITPDNFYLEGDGNYIRLNSSKANTPVALAAEGKLEMTLLSVLTPFFDDLKGLLNFNLDLRGKLNELEFSGNTYIKDAYLKLKQFPHPIEQYSADILFDNNRLILNSLKGRIAGGSLSASGQILFKGYKNIPINISGQFIDASFEVPSGFFTRGSGDVQVSGNWLPYTLSTNFNIVNGRVNKEIKSEKEDRSRIAPSPFLPEAISRRVNTPILLDLNIQLPEKMPVNLLVARLDIRASVGGQLTIKGSPLSPMLAGRININKGSEVIFRENTFEVLNGYVQYNSTDPSNPTLNLTAFSTILAKVGATEEREIDVTLRILGSAQNPEVNISSQPSLAEKDLISLLAFGFIPNTTQENETGNPSYQIGSAFLNEQLGLNREIGKRLGVQFDYSTGFDNETQANTHTFSVKKQWTPKFGASVSRSIGKTNRNNVRAEYKINNNLSVIGSYEGEEQAGSNEVSDAENDTTNQFGVDLEYKVDFK